MAPWLLAVLVALGVAAGEAACRLLPRIGIPRVNFRGQPIYSAGGLAFLAAAAPWLLSTAAAERRMAVAALVFGLLGYVDDRWGTPEFKGLRGHLGALCRGRLTTGLLKAAGGVVAALALGAGARSGWSTVPAALLIALGANLFNLFDLRPLRALKLLWLLALPLLGAAPLLAAWLGLSLSYGRREARRAVMLGDTGANALGGALGTAAAAVLPDWGLGAAVALLVLFHLWAERHSLSAWIEAHPRALRIDRWGGWHPGG